MKKVVLFAVALLSSVGLYAQEAETMLSNEEVQQTITELEKSGKVIFADSYEGKAIAEFERMKNMNRRTIEVLIKEFLVEELGLPMEDAQKLYDDVDNILQNVECDVTAGTIAKMVTFISKETLVDALKGRNKKHDYSGISDYIQNPDAYVLDDKLRKKVDALTYQSDLSSKKEEVKPVAAVAEEPVSAPVVAVEEPKAEPVVPVTEPEPVVEPASAAPAVPEVKKEEVKPVVATVAEEPKVNDKVEFLSTPEVITKIIAASGSQAKVGSILTEEQEKGNIKFGNASTMSGIYAACCIVIVERGSYNIVAVLSPESGYRADYITKTKMKDRDFDTAKYARIYVQVLK